MNNPFNEIIGYFYNMHPLTMKPIFKPYFVLLILKLLVISVQAQSILNLIDKQVQSKNPYGAFHYKFEADSLSDFYYPVMVGQSKHIYMWHRNKLLFQLDGTGKLLRLDSNNVLTRIDSTTYEGYNYGAFNFVYKDTVFSLGGYGFWQFNGLLRYFSEKTHSWSVIKTNTQVLVRQWYNGQVYYDVADEKIYTIYAVPQAEWVMEKAAHDVQLYVQCFDLKTKLWWDKPLIADPEVFKSSGWTQMAMFNSPYGLITFINNEVKIFDFKNNRFGNINISKARILSEYWYQNVQLIMYSAGNQLIFINPVRKVIESVPFSEADITWTNTKLYSGSTRSKLFVNWPIFIIIIFVVGMLTLLYFRKIRSKKDRMVAESLSFKEDWQAPEQSEADASLEKIDQVKRNQPFSETLTTVEKGLMDLIIKNSSAGKMTSVIQVNEVLGISKKDVKAQNNIRATALQMINQKFTVYSGLQDELMMKQRTDFDKRFFEYFIHPKFINKVK
jgi:hypothetical protein